MHDTRTSWLCREQAAAVDSFAAAFEDAAVMWPSSLSQNATTAGMTQQVMCPISLAYVFILNEQGKQSTIYELQSILP